MIKEMIDTMPLWGVLGTTILVVWVAIEIGYRGALYRRKMSKVDNESQVNVMTGAHLGLFAFVLAFSFNMAAGHFDVRKKVMLEEANAIETAFLRTQLVSDAVQGEKIATLLREYAAVRAVAGNMAQSMGIIAKSESLHDQMWREVQLLATGGTTTVMDSLLVQAINEVFDLHSIRITAAVRNRIPPSIWVVLYVVLILSMMGTGFNSGIKGTRSPLPNAALALSFAMVMFLIADLERPTAGLVTADLTSLMDLNERLQR